MMTRRTLLGASKWAFRDLRRELDTDWLIFVMAEGVWWCWAGVGVVAVEDQIGVVWALGDVPLRN